MRGIRVAHGPKIGVGEAARGGGTRANHRPPPLPPVPPTPRQKQVARGTRVAGPPGVAGRTSCVCVLRLYAAAGSPTVVLIRLCVWQVWERRERPTPAWRGLRRPGWTGLRRPCRRPRERPHGRPHRPGLTTPSPFWPTSPSSVPTSPGWPPSVLRTSPPATTRPRPPPRPRSRPAGRATLLCWSWTPTPPSSLWHRRTSSLST